MLSKEMIKKDWEFYTKWTEPKWKDFKENLKEENFKVKHLFWLVLFSIPFTISLVMFVYVVLIKILAMPIERICKKIWNFKLYDFK